MVGKKAVRSRAGRPFDEDAGAAMKAMVECQSEEESVPMFLSGRIYDDGIIDPRDTRTMLGLCLSVIHGAPVQGTPTGYGVFRM